MLTESKTGSQPIKVMSEHDNKIGTGGMEEFDIQECDNILDTHQKVQSLSVGINTYSGNCATQ